MLTSPAAAPRRPRPNTNTRRHCSLRPPVTVQSSSSWVDLVMPTDGRAAGKVCASNGLVHCPSPEGPRLHRSTLAPCHCAVTERVVTRSKSSTIPASQHRALGLPGRAGPPSLFLFFFFIFPFVLVLLEELCAGACSPFAFPWPLGALGFCFVLFFYSSPPALVWHAVDMYSSRLPTQASTRASSHR